MMRRRADHRDARAQRPSGFTLVELLIAIALLAIIVAIVVPSFGSDDRVRLSAAAIICASDIEYAQVLSITQPDEPAVVRFDLAKQEYWLALASLPDEPIPHPESGEPYLVKFGVGRGGSAAGVHFEVEQMPGQTLTFEPHGGLATFTTDPRIVLTPTGAIAPRVVLRINATTGSVTLTHEP